MDFKTRESMGEKLSQTAQDLGSKAKSMSSAAWERTKSGYATVQDKTVTSAKATDRVIRDYPYQSIGIAFGLGLLFGLLWKRR